MLLQPSTSCSLWRTPLRSFSKCITEHSWPQDKLMEMSEVSKRVSSATWASTWACGRIWWVHRGPEADLYILIAAEQTVNYHFSSHKQQHHDKLTKGKCGRTGCLLLPLYTMAATQLLWGHSQSSAVLSDSIKSSGQLTSAWDVYLTTQWFIRWLTWKHAFTPVLIQMWELPKNSHQDVVLQVHKNSKVMEDNQLFQDNSSTPCLTRRHLLPSQGSNRSSVIIYMGLLIRKLYLVWLPLWGPAALWQGLERNALKLTSGLGIVQMNRCIKNFCLPLKLPVLLTLHWPKGPLGLFQHDYC